MRFKRYFCSILLTFFALAGAFKAFAQDAPDGWYYSKVIKSVSFQGLVNIKASELEGVTSSFVGKQFSDDVYEDLLNRVFALNYFENVSEIKITPTDGTYETCRTIAVVLVVEEYPVISKIKFSGYRQVRLPDLKEAVSSKEKDIYNESRRFMDERAVRDLYISKGFTEIKVSSSAEQNEDGNYIITFTIDEGEQTIVASIQFTGNATVSSNTLKRKISLKEAGLFKKASFQEALLEQDSRAIAAYYHDRGYIDARVLNYTIDSAFNEEKNRRELTIHFNIQEGSRYTFGGVTFEGNKVFSTEELAALVRLREGAVYNETRYQESIMAVRNKYFENGYTNNRFEETSTKDAEKKTVSYAIRISENKRSHIEDVIVRGNNKTKDNVILREIPIESGDIFSNAKITNGHRNLYSLQYFSQIYPEIEQGSEANLVNVIYNVEETSTTNLNLGLTFSGITDPEDFPIALYGKFQDSNLFGEGKTASVSTQLSTDEQSISLSYGQGWLFDKPISNNLSFSFSRSDEYDLRNRVFNDGSVAQSGYYMQYKQYEFNLTESLGHRWIPDFAILTLSGGISSSLIDNVYDSDLYTPYDSSVSDYANNWEPRNYLFAAFSMDGRDISYDPTKGWFMSQRLAWYGLLPQGIIPFAPEWGEKEFFLRTDTKLEKYFTLLNLPVSEAWAFKLVLMAYSGLSFQFPAFGSTIKQSNQLYLDGLFNARGWSIYNTEEGRGKAVLNNTLELRMPVLPGILAFDLFFDASVIKDTPSEFFSDFTNLDDWYFSYGPSIRFCIQQFPLRLLFVNNFQIDNGSIVWEDRYAEPTTWLKSWHFVLSFNITNR